MAVAIDASVGGTSANSYLLLADAQTIIDSWIPTDEITQWAAASTDTKNRALVSATERLDRESFLGARSTYTQSLQWPRVKVKRPDLDYGSNGYYLNSGFLLNSSPAYFPSDSIPVQVKKAQAAIALYLLSNPSSLGLGGLEQFKKVKVGPLEVEPVQPQDLRQLPPMVAQYLKGLQYSSSSILIVRG